MNNSNIILENEAFCLTLGADAHPVSLIVKKTGEEMLDLVEAPRVSMFSVTEERPFNNEVKLAFPNKRTTYPANRVRLDPDCPAGNRLILGFETAPFEAVIEFRIAPTYIGFRLADFIVHPEDYAGLDMTPPPVSEFRILQLPVRQRTNFGDWLNVEWDETNAVCVMAAMPETRIDSAFFGGARILSADAERGIRLRGTEAVLIASEKDSFLNAVECVENDYNLPHGVESRRSRDLNASIFWTYAVNPSNVDEYIRYAKQGGFRLMLIHFSALFVECGFMYTGDYDFLPEYPEGKESLRVMLDKIKAAGITPGLHILHPHIGQKSRYVVPHADYRLNLTRHFTLARAYTDGDTDLYVSENPEDSVMSEKCRILKFGGELFRYESYTTERPYRFTGCRRGAWETAPEEHPQGQIGGILDVSEFFAMSAYIDQNSDLQDEIADKIADAYNVGFRFVYFDGSEGTNAPFAYHVPNAQYRVYKKLSPEPMFSEGAAKAHFGWHILSGANAFDTFAPDVFKKMIVRHPAAEAPRMQRNFTRVNFGWFALRLPDEEKDFPGTQADLYEYGTAVAAAWNCPMTLQTTAENLKKHPRTKDLFEVIRRWELVRAENWLTDAQKDEIRKYEREFILLLNEQRDLEMVPYRQIETPKRLRAFLFGRNGQRCVVYWHLYGEGTLRLPLNTESRLFTEFYEASAAVVPENGVLALPASDRRYLVTDASEEEILRAFREAEI